MATGRSKTTSKSLFEDVYAIARRIPPGRVTTYGAIALVLGLPNGARQVGWAMAVCSDDVPAQRVVNASGGLSGNPHAVEIRRALLEDEGVEFDLYGRVKLDKSYWDPFGSPEGPYGSRADPS
jgi:methylated-DNA-protein-cysteine methyltransferase-like protein